MSLDIDIDDIRKLKSKDKKELKEQYVKYLKNVINFLKRYNKYKLQDFAITSIDASKNVSEMLKKNKYTISVLPDNSILIKTPQAGIVLETKLEKLKDKNYVQETLITKNNYDRAKRKIYVIRKGDKIITAFKPGHLDDISQAQEKAFTKYSSLDEILLKNAPSFIENEIKGRENLLLIKYLLDKKLENPDKKIYLDLNDFAKNYLEKYDDREPEEFYKKCLILFM